MQTLQELACKLLPSLPYCWGNELNGELWELQQAVRIARETENKVELLSVGGWAKDLGHGRSAGTGNSSCRLRWRNLKAELQLPLVCLFP